MTKIMTKGMMILSVISALCLAPELALAASHKHKHAHMATAPQAPTPKDKACIPMCEKDTLPCDPIYFKQADGRCTYFMD